MLQRGHISDGCVLASTLCKYDLMKGNLFVLHSILLLPLVTRCIETIDVCIWRMFVFMSVVVTVWGMGSMSVSSCRCCMCGSCVHHVQVLNAAFVYLAVC